MTLTLPVTLPLRVDFARQQYICVRSFLSGDVADNWAKVADTVSKQHGVHIERSGGDRLSYSVVTGDAIRKYWPALYEVYQSEQLRRWVAEVTGEQHIFTSSHVMSAININRLESPENAYRWHYDAVAYTLLIYLTSTADAGGALELVEPSSGRLVQITPEPGLAVLIDGTKCRHRSAPLTRRILRLSIPMVFPATAAHQRPENLDAYLYSGLSRRA